MKVVEKDKRRIDHKDVDMQNIDVDRQDIKVDGQQQEGHKVHIYTIFMCMSLFMIPNSFFFFFLS